MNAYLENALSLEEYRVAKSALVGQKQLLKEKLSAFEKKSHNRFELTDKFLKSNITNAELANERTNEENLHLFKKVGSNFQIKDRTVLFEPRGAWRTLSESGFCGGNALVSRLRRDPVFAPETHSEILRKGRDSNSRYRFGYTDFPGLPVKPLLHPSAINRITERTRPLCKPSVFYIPSISKIFGFKTCIFLRRKFT